MKTYKKLALIILLTGIFQVQAINFNDIAEAAQNNPKTTAAIALAGICFNYWKINPSIGEVTAQPLTRDGKEAYGIWEVENTGYSLTQKIGCILLPFMYGFLDRAPNLHKVDGIEKTEFEKNYPNFTVSLSNTIEKTIQ